MHQFTIQANQYLQQEIRGFYHTNFVGYQNPGNPDYINILKNTFNNCSMSKLNAAVKELDSALLTDLPQIIQILELNSLTACVVPRAKAEDSYHANQLLFKSTAHNIINRMNGFSDGTNYIIRHTDTKTTHLRNPPPNYANDGKMPYPGITKDTCHIADDAIGKDILLIDDVYTQGININEDAIQALLNKGVRAVTLYTIGYTNRLHSAKPIIKKRK